MKPLTYAGLPDFVSGAIKRCQPQLDLAIVVIQDKHVTT
jgi:hypothetical protein